MNRDLKILSEGYFYIKLPILKKCIAQTADELDISEEKVIGGLLAEKHELEKELKQYPSLALKRMYSDLHRYPSHTNSKEEIIEIILYHKVEEVRELLPKYKKMAKFLVEKPTFAGGDVPTLNKLKTLKKAMMSTNNEKRLHYLAILLNIIGLYSPFSDLLMPERGFGYFHISRNVVLKHFDENTVTADLLFNVDFETSEGKGIPKYIIETYLNKLFSRISLRVMDMTEKERKNIINSIALLASALRKNQKAVRFFGEWYDVKTNLSQ